MNHRAFTLIELLAVLVILGVVTALGLGGLAAADSTSKRQSLDSALRDLDAKARLIARMRGAVIFEFDDTQIRVRERNSSETQWILPIPGDAQVLAHSLDGSQVQSILIDAAGRSMDVRITRRWGDLSRHWSLEGLTGRWSQENP
jgi:prepilin-type N-terminal cleavage/methylation domain-containing protein